MHDRDPLEHVTAAWVESFDDLTTLGSLELEIERVLVALGRDAVSLHDYYVVLAPEALSPTWKHWWLGVRPQTSPARVIPVALGGFVSAPSATPADGAAVARRGAVAARANPRGA